MVEKTEKPLPHYIEEVEEEKREDLNVLLVNMSRFSLDGHSWNGAPMINLLEDY